jgi:Cupin domain
MPANLMRPAIRLLPDPGGFRGGTGASPLPSPPRRSAVASFGTLDEVPMGLGAGIHPGGFCRAGAYAQSMEISKNGTREGLLGSEDYFTGTAYVEPLFAANDTLQSNAGAVTFLPGARSAWHTHPGGQFLIVTDGTGWVQEEGGEERLMQPGDGTGPRPESGTGMGRLTRPRSSISLSSNMPIAATSSGWSTSPMKSISTEAGAEKAPVRGAAPRSRFPDMSPTAPLDPVLRGPAASSTAS